MANYDSTHTGATIDSAVSQVTDSTTDLNIDSNTLVVDKSANSVGIGTASPAVLTHLSPGGSYGDNPTLRISMTQADGYRPYLSLDNTHTGGREYQLTSTNDSDGAYSGGKFVIVDADDSGAARLVIDSSGNVGIGTAAPTTEVGASTVLEVSAASGTAAIGLNYDTGSSRWEIESDAGDDLTISRNGTSRLLIDGSTADISVQGGDIIFGTAGKGICLGVTSNTDANTLDDYEEGTWTMGLLFGGNGDGITYSANTGFYTKIGNVVTISGECVLTSKGSSNGGVRFSGFPFTVNNSSSAKSAVSLKLVNVSFADSPSAFTDPNRADAQGLEVTNAGAMTALTDADFSDNSEYVIHATYRAA